MNNSYVKFYHLIRINVEPTASGTQVVIASMSYPWYEKSFAAIPYDYGIGDGIEQAKAYLEDQGFDIIGKAEIPEGYALISATFKKIRSKVEQFEHQISKV